MGLFERLIMQREKITFVITKITIMKNSTKLLNQQTFNINMKNSTENMKMTLEFVGYHCTTKTKLRDRYRNRIQKKTV